MSDYPSDNRETPADRAARRARAQAINAGARGSDGLTDAERHLLVELRRQGVAIRQGRLVDERHHRTWQHARIAEMERRP